MNDKVELLQVSELRKRYLVDRGLWRKPQEIIALRDVSFSVARGETLAVVGESGSGKSTLARQLLGLEQPDHGQILFDGRPLQRRDRESQRQLRREVRMVFQNPAASLNPRVSIGTQFDQTLQSLTRLGARQRHERINETLLRVGLQPDHRDHFPHMFSGGQRQRLAIARAILGQARLVVADEPVSALDASVQAQIINLLLDLQRELGLSYVLISHDLGVVRHMSDAVLVLYAGEVMEQGPADQVFAAPRHPYTRALVASSPALQHQVQVPPAPPRGELSASGDLQGCPFFSRCPYAEQRCASERPSLQPVAGRLVACHRAQDI